MNDRTRHLIAIFALLGLAFCAGMASASDPAGHWEGTIELPGTELELDIDIAFADGEWTGDITIPVQGVRDLALEKFEVGDGKAVFRISTVPGEPTFHGELRDEGKVLGGQFTQSGGSYPFTLSRTEDPAVAARDALADLDGIIADALADWQTPGLGLGIVKNGEVVMATGYGLRDVEKELPVTGETLFAIGSSTKAFTAFALAQLVEEGKLDWDAPVADYLPDFKLYDDYASDHISPRDLVRHSSGLPRHDLVWYGNERHERADLVARLPYLQPNKELRELWQYNNLMFMTAGYLAGQLRGATWEEVVQAEIFDRLGMTRSNFSVDVSQADADHARPYLREDDEVREVDFRNIDDVGPAGSINSCASDMALWLQAHLGGSGGDDGILGAAGLEELHAPQMVIAGQPREGHLTPMSYGMGWFVDTWRGHYRVQHGGNIDGFTAAVWLFPRDGLGIVALSNRSGDAVPGLACSVVSDRLLELEPMDHVGTAAARRDQARSVAEESEENKERFRHDDTKPSRDADEYAGRFEHPGYGVLEITADGDDLTMLFNGMTMPLRHWHYDVYSVEAVEDAIVPEDMKVGFLGDAAGKLSRVEVGMESSVDPIVFTRLPDAGMDDPAYLARLAGKYEIPPMVVTVEVRGTTLVAHVPGQPPYTLVAVEEDEFALEGLQGYSLKFVLEGDGVASEAVFIQPEGVFSAKRVDE